MATDSKRSRSNVAVLLLILTLSAITMVVLFWRFPVATALVTVTVLAALGLSARLARSIEASDITDIRHDHVA